MTPLVGSTQSNATDSALYQRALQNTIQLYKDSLGPNLRLFSGTEFSGAYRSSAGHPYFETADAVAGDIIYNDVRYPGMLLRYDLVNDQLICIYPRTNLNITLINQKVNAFTIGRHLFLQVHDDAATIDFPGAGFYELLNNGRVKAYVRRSKLLRDAAKPEDPARFIQSDVYFLEKENRWFKIDGKKSLLAACKDRKAELAKYIQQHGLNFKTDPAGTIVQVIDHYVRLIN
jgi:hypothetical protein